MNEKHLGFFVKLTAGNERLHARALEIIPPASNPGNKGLIAEMNNLMVVGSSVMVKDCAVLQGTLIAAVEAAEDGTHTVNLGNEIYQADGQLFLTKSNEKGAFNIASWLSAVSGCLGEFKLAMVAEGLKDCVGFLYKRRNGECHELYLYFPRFQPALFQPYDLLRDRLNEDLKSATEISADHAIDVILRINNYLVNTRVQGDKVEESQVTKEKTDGC